jgi:hypothetical protein
MFIYLCLYERFMPWQIEIEAIFGPSHQMLHRVQMPPPDWRSRPSDPDFKTPTNAARRLLDVIHRIEGIPDESSDSPQSQSLLLDSPEINQSFTISRPRKSTAEPRSLSRSQIFEELRYIKRYVEALDVEYRDQRFSGEFEI